MRLSQKWHNLVGGKDSRLTARLIKLPLALLSRGYGVIIALRNLLYDHRILPIIELPVPVISVGNITVGGTGKTPMVIWLARYLQSRGRRVAVLTRGYKGRTNRGNDETQLLRDALPGVPLVVDSDRLCGAKRALIVYGARVLLLDDGFQHRRLRRDLDIVMIDATCPFGYEKLLPAGLLRESLKALCNRADFFIISRCDQVSEKSLQSVKERLHSLAQRCVYNSSIDNFRAAAAIPSPCLSVMKAKGIYGTDGQYQLITQLQGQKVFAFCGIGRPKSFIDTLKGLGAEVTDSFFWPDHHNYTEDDLNRMQQMAQKSRVDWLVTTQKDWVKIKLLKNAENLPNLFRLQVEIELRTSPELDTLCDTLDKICREKNQNINP